MRDNVNDNRVELQKRRKTKRQQQRLKARLLIYPFSAATKSELVLQNQRKPMISTQRSGRLALKKENLVFVAEQKIMRKINWTQPKEMTVAGGRGRTSKLKNLLPKARLCHYEFQCCDLQCLSSQPPQHHGYTLYRCRLYIPGRYIFRPWHAHNSSLLPQWWEAPNRLGHFCLRGVYVRTEMRKDSDFFKHFFAWN